MDFKKGKDNELANETQIVLRGQVALVEAMTRLKDSVIEQSESTNKLNTRLLYFTIAIFALTALQVFILIAQFIRN